MAGLFVDPDDVDEFAPEPPISLDSLAVTGSDQRRELTLAAPLPTVCVVHGQPASTTRTAWIRPHNKLTVDLPRGVWSYFPGGSPFWQAMENLAKRLREQPVVRAEWPLCSRCASGLFRRRLSAAILATVGTLAFVGTIVLGFVGIRGPSVTAAFIAGPCAIALSVPVFYATRPEKLLHATATPDGTAVIVTDPHPNFAAAVRATER